MNRPAGLNPPLQLATENQLPQSEQAEQAVLGCLLLGHEGDARELVFGTLRGDDFYYPQNRMIYAAFHRLFSDDQSFDVVMLSNHLKERKELDQVGGIEYLNQLLDSTPSSKAAMDYASIVHRHSVRRRLIDACDRVSRLCSDGANRSAKDLVEEAEETFFQLRDAHLGQEELKSIEQVLAETLATIRERAENQHEYTGIPTGFHRLDQKTLGLQPSDLIILAARPSLGKTSLAMNIAAKAANWNNGPVVFFSIEMSDSMIAQRLISAREGPSMSDLLRGSLKNTEWKKLEDSIETLKDYSLYIDSTVGLTPLSIRAKLRRLVRQHKVNPALVIVDYLQLMQANENLGTQNRNQEISSICRALKGLAKDFNCPMLVLSQLSRQIEHDVGRAPQLSDLRDSGSIEQDADLVLFLHRGKKKLEPAENPNRVGPINVDLIIGKHRNGPTGKIALEFDGAHTRFSEASDDRQLGGKGGGYPSAGHDDEFGDP